MFDQKTKKHLPLIFFYYIQPTLKEKISVAKEIACLVARPTTTFFLHEICTCLLNVNKPTKQNIYKNMISLSNIFM